MTTDTKPKLAAAGGPGFAVGGMAKGSGMIHPDLATMLAVVTTDYPLVPGEAIDFLRPAVEESFNSISVDGDCSTNDAVILLANGVSGIERTPAGDLAFAAALRKVCRDLAEQIVADGEGVTVLAEIAVTGAADDRQAKAIAKRIATSALVKTALFGRDANWGRVLMAAGSAPYNGGYAEVDVDRVTLSYNGSVVLSRGAPLGVEPDVSGATCTIGLDLGLGSGTRVVPDERPVLRLRPHQRGLPFVSRIVVKVGGAVAGSVASQVNDLATSCCKVVVVHGAGPQISAEMERRGLPVEFVGGRRVTTPEALEVVRASFAVVNAALCTAIGPRAVPLFGDEIGLVARQVPELGLVGDPIPCRPPAIEAALAAGLIPVVAPLAVRPAERERRRGRVRPRDRPRGREDPLPDRRSRPAARRLGGAVDRGAARRRASSTPASSRAGSCPSCRRRSTAAKLGVRAEIGETAVLA